ncbi:TetR/AcrR family transcriptional regulator [Bogoriella caseilytica]|uniref:TetR family transcriptional regulator n=1 Tax=Bogoriella caseilytica TaxID=56055 RepID=A0A3N2BCM6_9MICO|nr:TetR/AcrR family transcriptional regulator [Bogoriella caseilytica]ROR73011.1 TetR family transcriptional regulator [Bogoriella caseilytica]
MVTTLHTRDRILDAAELLFFRDGIAVTGVDAVAAEAGVSVVTLYKHHRSKENLLREVLRRRFDSWVEHWDAALERAHSPEGKLLSLFDAVATFRAAAGPTQWCCFLATASERPRPADPASDPVFALLEQDTALVANRLQALTTALGYREPEALAHGLLLIYNGILASLLRGAPHEPLPVARDLGRALIDSSRAAS